jgi:dolichol-phosphate mannosyltransferase
MIVTALLPAHNEQDVIGKMSVMLLRVYGTWIKHIVIVDDGSTDNTAGIIKALAKKDKRIIPVFRPHAPHGVGLAIREGLTHIPNGTTHILSMDADFIRNIPDLFEFFKHIPKYDGLIGSRYLKRYSLIRYPFLKKIFNRCFHLLVRLFYGVHQTDLTNNFKLYKTSVFRALTLTEQTFAINAETGLYPILLGYKIGELPVTWFARGENMGSSKFHLLRVADGYIRVLLKARMLIP